MSDEQERERTQGLDQRRGYASASAWLWVDNINSARTKLENRENLLQFKADLKVAAERLLCEGLRKPAS